MIVSWGLTLRKVHQICSFVKKSENSQQTRRFQPFWTDSSSPIGLIQNAVKLSTTQTSQNSPLSVVTVKSFPSCWKYSDFIESKWKPWEPGKYRSNTQTGITKHRKMKQKEQNWKTQVKLASGYYRKAQTFWLISLPFQTLLPRKVNRLYTFCWINLQEEQGQPAKQN